MKVPKIKYAVGSVAQAAVDGADSLLSEARKDVVAAREPEPAMPEEVEEMAEAVSKVQGSAETEAPKVIQANIKDTTKLVNSFEFQGGNKKMDKAFIMESLSEVADSSIVESKQSIAEFITDLHRVQIEQESKPLLSQEDFKKLTSFASTEERVEKKEGGEVSDVEKYINLYNQMEQSMDKAATKEDKMKIYERWQDVENSFDSQVSMKARMQMDAENEGREAKVEGGSLMAPDMPVDTYDNIPPEEMEAVKASQLPDNEMEEEYTSFVIDEALTTEDQEYLLNAIESDERLGTIFDKVMDIAGEFAGEGAVKGPGTGTSDSIPARLSDGEFVFTKKATDQIGVDKLQTMMDDAERAYDGGLMKKYMGGSILDGVEEMEDPDKEVHNQMLAANPMPSIRRR
jgi:hypothetical protein